jgi:hypothetical protein
MPMRWPLAARELVRIAARRRRRQADLVEQAQDGSRHVVAAGDAVHLDRLAERVG